VNVIGDGKASLTAVESGKPPRITLLEYADESWAHSLTLI
jgi:hypothetical protein